MAGFCDLSQNSTFGRKLRSVVTGYCSITALYVLTIRLAWRFGVSHAYVFVVYISFISDVCTVLSLYGVISLWCYLSAVANTLCSGITVVRFCDCCADGVRLNDPVFSSQKIHVVDMHVGL